MKNIQYDEFLQMIQAEKCVNLTHVEALVSDLVNDSAAEDDEFTVIDYANSPRKKLMDIAKLFDNTEIQINGSAEDYHNISVGFARENIYVGACKILQRGLKTMPYEVDLLADLIRYGISSGQYFLCKKPYTTLSKIPKSRWNWRAFSFSIDYLVETSNHINSLDKQEELKRYALDLANQFIEKMNSDQAYYDKSTILRKLGKDNLTNQTEQDVLRCGLSQVVNAPKCALRLADILFDKGEYQHAIDTLWRCCLNVFRPQPDINGSYAFLLLGLSKASKLFAEAQKEDYSEHETEIKSMYKDLHTALKNGLNRTFEKTAKSAINVISVQTNIEYPYSDSATDDPYDF